MNPRLKSLLRPIVLWVLNLKFETRKIPVLRFFPRFLRERKEWINQGGEITRNWMILSDYADSAGTAKGHYFHQDLLVARLIHEHNPSRHVDIASRIDGFVAHVASFRVIEVVDVRPLEKSEHQNIKFVQADLMNPQDLGKTDSLSCLHAIEHFGLGRYTDPIDVDGHNKGITNLVDLVSQGGRLYISFPIGRSEEIHFNAHRVFKAESILKHPSIEAFMQLIQFDYVDDRGHLHAGVSVEEVDEELRFGCGIYTFMRI